VLVTSYEAARIARALTDEQWQRCAVTKPTDLGGACPLLEQDGKCGVYSVRPIVCRLYRVSSPPSGCVTRTGVVALLPRAPWLLSNLEKWRRSADHQGRLTLLAYLHAMAQERTK